MTRLVDPAADLSPAAPDLVLDPRGDRFDFRVASADDRANSGGLRGGQMLATAIALCLASDAAGDPDPTDPAERDRRGWPGDGFDLDPARGETALGSTLWTRRRFAANDANAREIARRAEEALQPLVGQGLLGRVAVTASAEPGQNRIALSIRLEAPSGRVIFDGPYSGLWEALLAVRDPLAP